MPNCSLKLFIFEAYFLGRYKVCMMRNTFLWATLICTLLTVQNKKQYQIIKYKFIYILNLIAGEIACFLKRQIMGGKGVLFIVLSPINSISQVAVFSLLERETSFHSKHFTSSIFFFSASRITL